MSEYPDCLKYSAFDRYLWDLVTRKHLLLKGAKKDE